MATSSKHRTRRKPNSLQAQRVLTGMGQVYRLLRFFGMRRVGRNLFRKPRHVADLYVNGHFVRALYMQWNGIDLPRR